ncbi:MAG: pre-peptidase C-terminal domain-containing protein, partial [Rhodocyclaceae bacterium]|nr:pre-peptidase C-terminal domain-containing protein [Rhodocyclaceae bacterium]
MATTYSIAPKVSPGIGFDTVVAEGNAGSTAVVYTVTRSGDLGGSGSVAWQVSADSSMNAADFAGGVLPSGTVSFGAGQSAIDVTVLVAGDVIPEVGEMFALRLANAVGGTVGLAADSVYTRVTDEDGPRLDVGLGFQTAAATEGVSPMVIQVWRSARDGDTAALGAATTVTWTVELSPGFATAALEQAATVDDFPGSTLPAGVISFAAGETMTYLTITPFDDGVVEWTEDFQVRLTGASNANLLGVGNSFRRFQIFDDEPAGSYLATAAAFNISTVTSTPSFALGYEGTPGEASGTRVFTIVRGGDTASMAEATVTWAVTSLATRLGTQAADAADFAGGVLPSGTASFAAGQTAATVTIGIAPDAVPEWNESFRIQLTGASNGLLGDLDYADPVIFDDDEPTYSIGFLDHYGNAGFANLTEMEGTGGSPVKVVAIVRRSQTVSAASLNWQVIPFAANLAIRGPVDGLDFAGTVLPAGVLSFAAGSREATITVTIAPDAAAELNEMFSIRLTPQDHAVTQDTANPGRDSPTVTIVNDDALPSAVIGFDQDSAPWAVGEDAFAATRAVAVRRYGRLDSASTVEWSVSSPFMEGSVDTVDFTAGVLPSGTLSFTVGQAIAYITIGIRPDAVAEGNETFSLDLWNAAGAVLASSLSGTMDAAMAYATSRMLRVDDDDGTPTFSIAAVNLTPVPETNGLTTTRYYNVSRTGNTTNPSTVAWGVSGPESSADPADFGGTVLPGGLLSFAIGETAKLVSVNVVGDTTPELDETFVLRLTGPVNGVLPAGGTVTSLLSASTTTSIVDNDRKPFDVSFDFVGTTLSPYTQNMVTEGDVSAMPANYTVQLRRIASDESTASLGLLPTTVVWAVQLDTLPTSGLGPVTAADFIGGALPTLTATFAPGETVTTLTLPIANDAEVERGEYFSLRLLSADNAQIGAGVLGALPYQLNDDDLASHTFGPEFHILGTTSVPASSAGYEGSSGGTTFSRVFNIARLGEASTLPEASVQWAVEFGAFRLGTVAADAGDFDPATPLSGTASFTAGQVSMSVTLTLAADTVPEFNESFQVRLTSSSAGGIGVFDRTAMFIADDDVPSYSFRWLDSYGNLAETTFSGTAYASYVPVMEGNGVQGARLVGVVRRSDAASAASLAWAVQPFWGDGMTFGSMDGLDFAGGSVPSGTVSFAAGAVTATLTVFVAGDSVGELTEQFTIRLKGLDHAVSTSSTSEWIGGSPVLVYDDDPRSASAGPAYLAFDADTQPSVVYEDDFAATRRVTVRRHGALDSATTVGWTATSSMMSGYADAMDFAGGFWPSGTLSFAVGQATAVITLAVQADGAVESNETFTLSLGMPMGGTVASDTALTSRIFVIQDDDGPPVFSISQAGNQYVSEPDSGSVAKVYTVTRTGNVSEASSVGWGVSPFESSAGDADFAGGALPSGILNFAPGQTVRSFTIGVAGDTLAEGSLESFVVRLGEPSNGVLSLDTGTNSAAYAWTWVIENDTPFIETWVDNMAAYGMEGGTTSAITASIKRDGSVWTSSTVNWRVVGVPPWTAAGMPTGGSASPADFGTTAALATYLSGTVSFTTSQTEAFVTLPVFDDTVWEGMAPERFAIVLSDPSPKTRVRPGYEAPKAADGFATGGNIFTLGDNDTGATAATYVSITAMGMGEVTENSAAPRTFTVSRWGSFTGAATVQWTIDASAQVFAPTGYQRADAADFAGALSGTATFAAGSASASFTVAVQPDLLPEANEFYVVRLQSPSAGLTLSPEDRVVQTIADDDYPVVSVVWNDRYGRPYNDAFAMGSRTDMEGTGPSGAVFAGTIYRRGYAGQVANSASLRWSVAATAATSTFDTLMMAGDFPGGGLPTGTVTFAPGATAAPFTIVMAGDTEAEFTPEGYSLTLTPLTGIGGLVTAGASFSVVDDDYAMTGLPTPQLAFERDTQYRFPEAGLAGRSFTVRRYGDLGGSVTTTMSGTAMVTTTMATTVAWRVNMSPTDSVQAADFAGGVLPSGTLTFLPGQATASFTVPLIDDASYEPIESFELVLENAVGAALPAEMTLTRRTIDVGDDDGPPILRVTPWVPAMAMGSHTFSEGQTGSTPQVLAIGRSGNLTSATVVDWQVGLASAMVVPVTASDFVATAGAVTFTAGQTQAFVTVQVRGDIVPELDETFQINLSSANGYFYDPVMPGSATATAYQSPSFVIGNDDGTSAPATYTMAFEPVTAAWRNEGGAVFAESPRPTATGATPFVFTVGRTPTAGISAVRWDLQLSGSHAHATPADFTGATSGDLLFTANQATARVTVFVAADYALEDREWFGLRLTDPFTSMTLADAYASIVDDDDAFIGAAAAGSLAAQPMAVGAALEGNRFRIDLTGDQDWFRVELAAGQTYEFLAGGEGKPVLRLVAANGTAAVPATVTTTAFADAGISRLKLQAPTSGTYYLAVSGTGVGEYGLLSRAGDEDDYPANAGTHGRLVADFAGTDAGGFIEKAGDADWVRVDLDGGRQYDFGMNFIGGGATATFTLWDAVFGTQVASVTGFDAVGDEIFLNDVAVPTSGSYYLTVAGGAGMAWTLEYPGSNAPDTSSSPRFGVEAVADNVYEADTGGQAAFFHVFRLGNTDSAATVEWSVAGLAGDPVLGDTAGNALTGSMADDILVGGGGNDTLSGWFGERDVARYSGSRDGYEVSAFMPGMPYTVRDINPADGDEGTDSVDTIEVLAFADGAYGFAWSGTAFSLTKTTTPAALTDFADGAPLSGTLTFAPGQGSSIVVVPVRGDGLGEADEYFRVDLANPAGSGSWGMPSLDANYSRAEAVIRDDDGSGALFLATPATVTEGAGYAFTLSRTDSLRYATVVTWQVLPPAMGYGTLAPGHVAPSDFAGGLLPRGTVTFGVGQSALTVSFATANDVVVEADEAFSLLVSSSYGYFATTGGSSRAVGATLVNNDGTLGAAPAYAFGTGTAAAADRYEGGAIAREAVPPAGASATPFVFTVTRAPTSQATAVNWKLDLAQTELGRGNRLGLEDLAPAQQVFGELSFSAGQAAATLTVLVAADNLAEASEGFGVGLYDASGHRFAVQYANVLNDDDAAIGARSATAAGQTLFAEPLAVGVDHAGGLSRIDFAGDQDWYRVELNAGQAYEFEARGRPAGIDPSLKLFNAAGVLVADGAAGTSAAYDRIGFTAAAAGTYYLAVAANGAFSAPVNPLANRYVLVTRPGGATDDYADGTDSQARLVASLLADGRHGRIDFAGDQDWFQVRFDSGPTYGLGFTAIAAQPGDVLVATFRDAGGSSISAVAATATAAGAWFPSLQFADPFYGDGNDYFVSLEGSAGVRWNAAVIQQVDESELSTSSVPVHSVEATAARIREGDPADGGAALRAVPFNVIRTGATHLGGTARWEIAGLGGGLEAADFGPDGLSGTVSFAPGQASASLTVFVVADDADEGDESFQVAITEAGFGTAAGDIHLAEGSATVVIQDDDLTRFSIVAVDARKPEGDSGATSFVFAVSRAGASESGATVNWSVTGGDVNLSDFVSAGATAGALTFDAGVSLRYVTIAVKGDLNDTEANEDFTVSLADGLSARGTPAAYGAASADGTILNDDLSDAGADTAAGAAGVLSFTGSTTTIRTVADYVGPADHDDYYKLVIAGSVPANLKAHLSGLSADANLRLYQLGVDGTTLVPKDQSTNAGTRDEFVRLNGLTAGTFYVHVQQYAGETSYDLEIRAEESETFPEIVVFASAADRGEGNSGATPFVFTVVRTGLLATGSTVNWSVVGSTAAVGSAATYDDFVRVPASSTLLPSGVLTFGANVGVLQLTVNVAGDKIDNQDEGFAVTLTAGTNAVVSDLAARAEAVIRNDDVGTDLGANAIAQIGSASFTASDRGLLGVTPDVIVDFVGATDTDDYYRFRIAGDSDVRLLLTDLTGDANLELLDARGAYVASSAYGGIADEVIAYEGLPSGTYIARVYAKAGADTGYQLRLSGLPPLPTVRVVTDPESLGKDEGGEGATTDFRFDIVRSGDLSQEGGVAWRVLGILPGLEGADFVGGSLPSGTVSFSAGESVVSITIHVAGDAGPLGVETDEPFAVQLLNPAGLALHRIDNVAGAIIINDDNIVAPPALIVGSPGLEAVRAEGPPETGNPFVFRVHRIGGAEQLASASTVEWAVEGLAAGLTGEDFQGGALPSGTVVLAPGEVTATLTVTVAGDALAEADDPFRVRLTGADWGVVVGGADAALGVIRNDDMPPVPPVVAVRAGSGALAEGGEGTATPFTFQVLRTSGNSDVPVEVAWQVSLPWLRGAGADDFAGGVLPSGSVTLGGGETAATITVGIFGDTAPEFDEAFLVRLTGVIGGVIDPLGAVAGGLILNDDQLTRFGVRAATPSAPEGDAGETTAFEFTVTRSGNLLGAADTVAWSVLGLQAGAADFDGGVLPSGTVTFSVGQETATVSVFVAGDAAVEANELFAVLLSDPIAGIGIDPLANVAVAGIRNDDGSVPEVWIATVSEVSGEAGTDPVPGSWEGDGGAAPVVFQLTRSGANLGLGSVVKWGVSGALVTGADFVGGVLPTGTFSFAAGQD